MSTLEENLFAGLGVNGADGVVAAAKGDGFAVRRPRGAVNGIEGHRVGQGEGFVFHIPDLHFTHAAGFAAGYGQPGAVRREANGFNSFAEANQAGLEAGAIGLVQQHLVETGNGQQFAVRRIIDGGDHRRQGVHGWIVSGIFLAGSQWSVVLGTLGDPFFDQFDLRGVKRFFAAGHRSLACFGIRKNQVN